MAPHFSTLARKIPWTEEPGGLQSTGSLRVGHDWGLHFHFSLSCIGEGNGNTLQCSCLENPRDGGALWAAIYGVTQSRTWSDLAAAAPYKVGCSIIITPILYISKLSSWQVANTDILYLTPNCNTVFPLKMESSSKWSLRFILVLPTKN